MHNDSKNMIDENRNDDNIFNRSKKKKLKSFANWSQWSELTIAILIKKNIQNFIKNGFQQLFVALWEQKIKENHIAIGITI